MQQKKMKAVFVVAVALSALAVSAQVPTSENTVTAWRQWTEMLDRLPKVQPLTDAQYAEAVATAATATAIPPRARSAKSTLTADDSDFPPVYLYCPGGALSDAVRPKVECVLFPRVKLGEVLIYQNIVSFASFINGTAQPRPIRGVISTSVESYRPVPLGENTFSLEAAGMYFYHVWIVRNDPNDRRQIADLYHPLLVDRYQPTDALIRMPWGVKGAMPQPNGDVMVIGNFLSDAVAAQIGTRQFLFVPGAAEMRLALGEGGIYARIPVNGHTGYMHITYCLSEVRAPERVSCFTGPDVLVEPPIPAPTR